MKIAAAVVVALVAVVLLFTVVFPWVDRMLADPVMGTAALVDPTRRL